MASWNRSVLGGVIGVVEGRPPDERELVLRAQRGDERAFATLVRAHWEISFRVAYMITRNSAEAEDASQEALLKAWRALGRFRPSDPLRPWLLRIVANEARNRQRSTSRRAHLALRAQIRQVSGGAVPSPEDLTLAADSHRQLLGRLEQLPEPTRLVLCCRYLLELSEAETATVLGVKPGTVKSRTARALERLRESYE